MAGDAMCCAAAQLPLTAVSSVKVGQVKREVCSSFHSLATSSVRQALTGPGSSRPPPLASTRLGFSQSRNRMSTLCGHEGVSGGAGGGGQATNR
jgi:hypothetical protein